MAQPAQSRWGKWERWLLRLTVPDVIVHSEGEVSAHARPDLLNFPVALKGVTLPFGDGLVVVAGDGAVVALDVAGRQLWEALQTGCTVNDLIAAGRDYGAVPSEVARANLSSALESWRALGLIDVSGQEAGDVPLEAQAPTRQPGRTPALDEVYRVGDRPVQVRCDDLVLGKVIDAACGSHRVEGVDSAPACVDVIEQDDGLVVKADDALLAKAEALTQNLALARHRCLTALLEAGRYSRRWLGILHASAVSVDRRCGVFPGARGSGKSTLAVALVAAGADFVTDDYAPLEQASWRVWPVPYAPSIKSGAWRPLKRYYPDIYELPVHHLADQRIRYLNLDVWRMAPLNRGLPVSALVFPRYKAGTMLTQRRMTAAEALAELCHAKSILDRRPEILAETLRWVESVPAYRLVYGDPDPAVERVLSLLRGA